jgi:DNA-binding MarR family transcriptional regulator
VKEKLLALLERLAQAERALLTREAFLLGLTATQAQLLLHLSERPQGVVDLAVLLALTPATVSEALGALEKKGLLERARDPRDARRWILRPTAKGLEVAQALKAYAKPLREALEEVEDQEGLFLGLLSLLAGLVRRRVAAETGMCFTCRHLRWEGGLFCTLLQTPLGPGTLRLTCPDHLPQAG